MITTGPDVCRARRQPAKRRGRQGAFGEDALKHGFRTARLRSRGYVLAELFRWLADLKALRTEAPATGDIAPARLAASPLPGPTTKRTQDIVGCQWVGDPASGIRLFQRDHDTCLRRELVAH